MVDVSSIDSAIESTMGDAGGGSDGGGASDAGGASGAQTDSGVAALTGQSTTPQQQRTGQDTRTPQQIAAQGKTAQPQTAQVTQAGARGNSVDDKGNVRDANGNIIAQAGQERRWLQEFSHMQHTVVPQYKQTIAQLNGELQGLRQSFEAVKSLGITNPADMVTGVQILSSFRQDPGKTIEYLLTQAKAAGKDIKIDGSSIDTAAIRQLIDTKMAPITQRDEAVRQEQQAVRQATEQYNNFVGDARYPNARIHEGDIAQIIERAPQVSLGEAYLMLKSFALENGLDFNQPLTPQFQARLTSGAQGADGGGQQRSVARPSPGRNGGAGNATQLNGTRSVASAGSRNKDIVREAMREAGLAI